MIHTVHEISGLMIWVLTLAILGIMFLMVLIDVIALVLKGRGTDALIVFVVHLSLTYLVAVIVWFGGRLFFPLFMYFSPIYGPALLLYLKHLIKKHTTVLPPSLPRHAGSNIGVMKAGPDC